MSDFNSSKIRLSVPILMSRQVVLPGWTSDITLSTTEQKAMFNEIMDFGDYSNKTLNYVGVVPIKSSRKAPQVGDIGAYCKILSCLAKLGAKDVMKIRVLGEKRMKIEDISSTSNYCVAEISILEDIEEPFQDVIDTLEKHDFPFSWPRGKPLNQVSLQQSLKHLEKGLEDCISRQNSMSREDEIKLLETLRFSDRLALLLTAFDSKSNGGNLPPFTTRVRAFVSVPGNGSKKIPILPTFGGVRLPPTTNIFSLRDGLAEPGINNLSTKIQEAGMPAEVHKIAMEEFNRLSSMPAHGAEHALLRNYLETLVSLPWRVASTDVVDVNKAKAELESHHYGMEKVKRRVLEYLAVKQLTKSHLRGPILSFVGPPGVGKTSIARSIASILGRKFHRIGLGGMCDASDIRGSRRTYIGSMPGRIIKAIQYCGTNNPVILLDEIDKMGSGHLNGNPLAVLLEVLDPEQNSQFTDHYLGVPFDLSQVIFVGTANSMDSIPPALIDRIEVIEVNGYTEEEKFHIARDFIIPKSLAEHGLDEEQVVIPDESLQFIISSYSRESGVRTLERKIGALLRDAALKIAADLANNVTPISLMIDVETAKEVLGGSYYHKDADLRWIDGSVPGVVVGLAYTALGGEILPIEASKIVPGKGKLILTGKLGKVISESAQIAFDWFKTAAMKYGIYEDMTALDLHLHLPAGAVSKDGPSAGIALATALVSLFSGSPPIPRIALTGEITLQGHVLPVGGLKEKLSAARKVGITKVILPKKCENSLRDIPQHLLDQLELMLVEHMSEVVECAFDGAVAENSPLVSKL